MTDPVPRESPVRRRLRAAAVFGAAVLAVAVARAAPWPGGMLIVNEDNSHFFGSRPPEDMTRAGLHAWVDGYAGTAVTHLFLNPTAMRASFRSRTREAIWDPVDGAEPTGLWPQNAKRLHLAGLDPYAVWIARARERGLSPWISLRMNDVHSVEEPGHFMHSAFWRDHPQFRRTAGRPAQPWTDFALNYAHPEVRAHALDHLRELFERYDADGFELDWMRFPFHLTPGRAREEAPILADFMREVRALADTWAQRRGHPIRLGVRVPAHPEAAAGLGLDAAGWARAGLADLIVPTPFWRTSDFDIPLGLWRERLGDAAARVAVVPGFEHNLRAWLAGATVPADLAALRGFAATMRHRGADSFYLFNWMDSQTRPVSAEDYAVLLREGLSPAALAAAPRRHPVTFRDTVPPGFPDGTQLPVEAPAGADFRIVTGARGGHTRLSAVVGLADRPGVAAASLEAALNGHALAPAPDVAAVKPLGAAARGLRWHVPAEAWRDGDNTLTVRQADGGPAQQIVWVELRSEAG